MMGQVETRDRPAGRTDVEAHFDFYGLSVEIRGTDATLVEQVRKDFTYFGVRSGRTPPDLQVELRREAPPYEGLPDIPASVYTPRNICFRLGTRTYIDYFNRALAVFDRRERRLVVHAQDDDLLHEIAYLFLLSSVGQHLDRSGLHRVHALGVSHVGNGMLLLLPSGGGKSTMALELLRQPEFRLLGEDTPLIDRSGMIHPFLLRLGVRPGAKTGVPPQHLRTVRRMEFDPKTLIDLDFFRDRLATPGEAVEPRFVLVGQRSLGGGSEIVPMSRRKALSALIKYSVVGLGIYQGLEFLLERGVWELAGKGGTVVSRLYSCCRLLARTSSYRFVLGRDPQRNRECLLDFIRRADG